MRWIVGTAEYQVAPWAAQSLQNALAEKRRGAITQPPEPSVASVEATSPWTWKSGIAQWLASLAGEPVGGGDGARRGRQVALADGHALRLARRAAGVQEQRDRLGIARRRRARRAAAEPELGRARARELELPHAERGAGRARRALLAAQEEHRARPEVLEVGVELVGRVGLVERRRRGARGHDAEEGRHDLRAVRAGSWRRRRPGARRPRRASGRAGRPSRATPRRSSARRSPARPARARRPARRAGRAAPREPPSRAIPCRRRQLPASTSAPMPAACASVSQRRSTAVPSTRLSASRATCAANHATSGSLASSEP